MNEIEFENLRADSWQRKLTPAEENAVREYLSFHPEARTLWEEETRLTDLMGRIPDVPVSSNFTARTIQAAAREGRFARQRPPRAMEWLKAWWPRLAISAVVASAAVFSVVQYRSVQRVEMARDLATMSQAGSVPQEWLQDFEAINRLSHPPVDEELLAALQ